MLAHPDFGVGSLLCDIQKGSSHKTSVGEVAMIIYVYPYDIFTYIVGM